MALTIAIGIVASAWVFGQLEAVVADVTGYSEEEVEPTEVAVAASTEPAESNETDSSGGGGGAEQESDDQPNAQPTVDQIEPTEAPDLFESTHISNPDFTVNLRPGPSVASGDPITSVPPATPLRFIGDQGLDEEGLVWLHIETQDGTTGWIREVDTIANG